MEDAGFKFEAVPSPFLFSFRFIEKVAKETGQALRGFFKAKKCENII